MTGEFCNWSATYHFTAREAVTARTAGEVRRAAAKAAAGGGRVRAPGTRHSFSDLAGNGATLAGVTGRCSSPRLERPGVRAPSRQRAGQ